MRLDLTDAEAQELKDALDARLLGLMEELVHTDDRHCRVDLRDIHTHLARVRDRLERGIEGEGEVRTEDRGRNDQSTAVPPRY